MKTVEQERRDRRLRTMSASEYVLLGWLTGETLEPRPPTQTRRRAHRKTARRRNLPSSPRRVSG